MTDFISFPCYTVLSEIPESDGKASPLATSTGSPRARRSLAKSRSSVTPTAPLGTCSSVSWSVRASLRLKAPDVSSPGGSPKGQQLSGSLLVLVLSRRRRYPGLVTDLLIRCKIKTVQDHRIPSVSRASRQPAGTWVGSRRTLRYVRARQPPQPARLPRIAAGVRAFSLTPAVTERDIDPRNPLLRPVRVISRRLSPGIDC
jgi:hypothetical protein